MGTRSLTVMNDESNKEIAVMYRQYDGYPSGHGEELAEFLKEFLTGNGIPGDLKEKLKKEGKQRFANGMDCLAAQIVTHFKSGGTYDNKHINHAGGIYLYPAGSRDCGEEYIYTVYQKKNELYLRVEAGCMTAFGLPGTKQENMNVLYDGPVSKFTAEECEKKEEQLSTPPNDFAESQKE